MRLHFIVTFHTMNNFPEIR